MNVQLVNLSMDVTDLLLVVVASAFNLEYNRFLNSVPEFSLTSSRDGNTSLLLEVSLPFNTRFVRKLLNQEQLLDLFSYITEFRLVMLAGANESLDFLSGMNASVHLGFLKFSFGDFIYYLGFISKTKDCHCQKKKD